MQELFADIKWDEDETVTADLCREIATSIIFDNQIITGVAETIITQTLNEVNWYEIAELIEEDK